MDLLDTHEKEIMDQDRHLFVYCDDSDLRKKVIKKIDEEYKTTFADNKPISLVLEDNSLPIIEGEISRLDSTRLIIIAREFLHFNISKNLLEKMSNNLKEDQIKALIDDITRSFFINKEKVHNINELYDLFNSSANFYTNYYTDFLQKNEKLGDINDLEIPFIDAISFIKCIKSSIGYDSYIGLIINNDKEMNNLSKQAINELITRRCNDDLSVKVFTPESEWKNYHSISGMLAESIHDYGTINLDKSYKKELVKRKTVNGNYRV